MKFAPKISPTFSAGRFFSFKPLLLAGLAVSIAACSTTAPGTSGVPAASKPADKTLLGVYMVGSNLEDDVKPRDGKPDEQATGKISTVGASSYDLLELVSAWQSLSPAAQSRLEVVVAFGGARKQGWTGVKYADMPCLISDAGDEYFGNASCYSYSKADANMAEPSTLSHFLAGIKTKYADHGRKVFEIWNHGLSYLGAGQDSTQIAPTDYLTLPEMKQAFASGPHFDLIAFDACLMASLEVARTMAPFGDYMIASEELEPAHGWYYEDVVNALSADISLTEAGKKIVDSFVDQAAHKKPTSNQKTLSLIDLRQADATRSALDTLVGQINLANFNPLLQSLSKSQQFGSEPLNGITYSLDLRHWATQLKTAQPALASAADKLLAALDKMVLHARHDDNKPDAYGLSIYSLNLKLQPRYGADQSVSDAWLGFARRFIAQGTADSSKPSVTSSAVKTKGFSTSAFTTAQQSVDLCSRDGKSGHCLSISDNLGLKRAEQVFALKADERYLFTIGSEALTETQGEYFAPVWDGEWFLVCDGDCRSGKSLFPPAYFAGLSKSGTRLYSGEAELNGLPVVFWIELGRNNAVVNQWAIPYEIGSGGEVILARDQLAINAGDTLSFWYQVFDLQQQKLSWKQGDKLSFSARPVWSFARVDAPRTYYVQAEDYKGNLGTGPLYQIN